MTNEQKAAHLAHLMDLAAAYDRKMNTVIIDRTPAGYGPGAFAGELPEMVHMTTEEQSALRSRNEADTIRRARARKGGR